MVNSVLPETEKREVHPTVVAQALGSDISWYRNTRTISEIISDFFVKYSIDADEDTFEVFVGDVVDYINSDTVYDSEDGQAYRACAIAVKEWLANPRTHLVSITGWIHGETVQVRGEKFTLTGQACDKCEINPEAYGIGGGVRCADTIGCRYWYCA